MPSRDLYLFIPFELDARGRCCKSRVIHADEHSVVRIVDHFRKIMRESRELLGLVQLYYRWNGREYGLERAATNLTGDYDAYDYDTVIKPFERFDRTIQYYEYLDHRGLPFPGDSPVIHPPDEAEKRSKPSPRARHSRRPPTRGHRRGGLKFIEFGTVDELLGNTTSKTKNPRPTQRGRVPRSHVQMPAPLFPSREAYTMALPPKGCHPFVKHLVTSDLARKKLSSTLIAKAFDSYELCDFGDVPRRVRESNFTALKRRRGVVVAHYNLGKHPFAIVTDMKDRIAHLMLRTEIP